MGKLAPTRIVLLALMLAVSHVALTSHVTSHFSPDLEQCELCVSYTQHQAAIPSSAQEALAEPATAGYTLPALPADTAVSLPNANRQRAPPSSST